MTVDEIVAELRAGRPRASDALRLQVLTHASRPAPRARSPFDRLRGGRRLALLVPTAAALAVGAAVVIGVTRSGTSTEPAATAPRTIERSADSGAITAAAPSAADAATARKAAPAPLSGRAQRYAATLTLQVEDTDALSDATQRALSVARDLGGHAVSVHYATGEDGVASMTLRVPSARAADAVARLSSLGTILAQDVQIDDLQESLDSLDRRLARLQAHIAALTAAVDRSDDDAERARLVAQRARVRSQLRELHASRAATAAEASTATIQLDLRTKEDTGAALPGSGSRLDRALDKALAVLAWEGVVLLAVALVAAPFAAIAAAAWAARRARRRREEDRLLAAS